MNFGKVYQSDTYVRERKYFIKTYQCERSYRRGISWRRAKKLMRRMHMRGSHRKPSPKWVGYAQPREESWSGYEINASYSRKRKVLFFYRNMCVECVEIEEEDDASVQ